MSTNRTDRASACMVSSERFTASCMALSPLISVMMQVEVSSRAGIDTLKRIACGVQSFPLIGVTWQGANGTKIVLIELHAYHSTARMWGTGVSVALFTAETFEPVVGGWTVVLEGLTCLFDTVIGHLANLAGLWTATGDYPTFVIDEVVDNIGVERPGRVCFAWQSWVIFCSRPVWSVLK